MVIDTSALVAIQLRETSCDVLLAAIVRGSKRMVASISLLEAGMVLRARAGKSAVPLLYELIDTLGIEIVPFDAAHAQVAIAAFERFGKGVGHQAQLNFGDCAVYAVAALRGDSILAAGKDFAATDLTVVNF